jgi:hypothetical protein
MGENSASHLNRALAACAKGRSRSADYATSGTEFATRISNSAGAVRLVGIV